MSRPLFDATQLSRLFKSLSSRQLRILCVNARREQLSGRTETTSPINIALKFTLRVGCDILVRYSYRRDNIVCDGGDEQRVETPDPAQENASKSRAHLPPGRTRPRALRWPCRVARALLTGVHVTAFNFTSARAGRCARRGRAEINSTRAARTFNLSAARASFIAGARSAAGGRLKGVDSSSDSAPLR